jgi:hypothetical protein
MPMADAVTVTKREGMSALVDNHCHQPDADQR